MASIPDNYLDLLQEKKAFANLATVRPNFHGFEENGC